jgi:hypothetical protein
MGTVDRRHLLQPSRAVKVLGTLASSLRAQPERCTVLLETSGRQTRDFQITRGWASPLEPRLAILRTRPLYVPQWQATCGEPEAGNVERSATSRRSRR